VGATGSGKSTIANLIPRFYDATTGNIFIDNINAKDITLGSLRRLIGIVHQDTFLFSGTIRENISYGKTDATKEEIMASARTAQLHDFITTLPQGYDTWIGERGVTLSGGQKQRLAIARTLLLNPSIIIMDDYTSSVDMETEYHIQQAMAKLLSGRTAFIIAQRLWSVQMADIVLVLRDGEIIERGTHRELMVRSSFYRELYSTQLQPVEAVEKTEPGLTATTAGDREPPEAPDNKNPNNHYHHQQRSATTLDRSEDTTFGKVYDSRVVSRLLGYLAPYKLQVLMATGATLVYTLTTVAVPYLIGVAINESIAAGDLLRLDLIILLFLGNGLLNWLAHYTQLIMEAKAGKQALFDLRCRLFNRDFLSSSALTATAELLSLAGIVIALIIMNLELALITFTSIPFLFLFLVFWRRHVRSYYLQIRAAIAAVNGMLQETISGVRVIQSLSRERVNSRRFEKLNRAHFAANVGAARISATMAPVVELLMAGATASVLVFGGAKTLAGGLQAGVLVAFAIYIQRFFDPIRTLTMEYAELQQAMASGVRIFELLDVKTEAVEIDRTQKLPWVQGEIRFENVSFGYNPGQEVLHNINLVIHPGEKVALVGPTGAGKSTLVSLLTRFYRVSQGRISIDGYDLNCVEPASFLQQVSVVLQEPFLFSATIQDNIRYGCLTASDAEIVATAEAVGADGFIRHLKKGYLTELEERGQNLSMGQRQLISFARALVGSPRIILLDEATASIDSYTETLIQKAMGHLLLGRTALIIAHRLSTVRNADRIIVLDRGKIVEEGKHEELITRGGLYARLYRMSYNSVFARR
jgi:ATP-binding cassette subfamily B protein